MAAAPSNQYWTLKVPGALLTDCKKPLLSTLYPPFWALGHESSFPVRQHHLAAGSGITQLWAHNFSISHFQAPANHRQAPPLFPSQQDSAQFNFSFSPCLLFLRYQLIKAQKTPVSKTHSTSFIHSFFPFSFPNIAVFSLLEGPSTSAYPIAVSC